jgi:protein-tyrosine-phosphatase
VIKILFVCSGNTCRSPMAKALLLKRLETPSNLSNSSEIQVWSAGLFTRDGLPASPEAIAAMREEGLDISSHRSLLISRSLVEDAELVLTMTVSQRDYLLARFPHKSVNIYTLSEFIGDETGEVMDPYGHGQEVYRQSLLQLNLLVDRLFYKITKLI